MANSSAAAAAGKLTRWLQSRFGRRAIGTFYLARLFDKTLPPFAGEITLENGLRFYVDTAAGFVEHSIFYAGSIQLGLAYQIRQHTPAGAYCLDAGANIGFFALMMAHYAGPGGRVAAFEPNPITVERLRHNVRLNDSLHIDIVTKAVSQQSGTTEFYLASEPEKSGISPVVDITPLQKIEVATISLDEYVAEQKWPRVDIIKIDVEGHDCQVLLGAKDIIAHFHPVITFEFSYSTDPALAAAAFELLISSGYTLHRVVHRSGFTLGKLTGFDWRQQTDEEALIDVLCLPAGHRQI